MFDSPRMEAMDPSLSGADEANERIRTLLGAASGGTIFLRELGRFSTSAQASLVNLLDAFEAAGGERIRIVASISEDVQAALAKGTLRPNLHARLETIELKVAPLRERAEEIAVIAASLLEASDFGPEIVLSEAALEELGNREWPGNDRELEVVLRLGALASGGERIDVGHLAKATHLVETRKQATQGRFLSLDQVMQAHVRETLRQCEGNKLRAAEMLGISRSTLYRMLDSVSPAAEPDRKQ